MQTPRGADCSPDGPFLPYEVYRANKASAAQNPSLPAPPGTPSSSDLPATSSLPDPDRARARALPSRTAPRRRRNRNQNKPAETNPPAFGRGEPEEPARRNPGETGKRRDRSGLRPRGPFPSSGFNPARIPLRRRPPLRAVGQFQIAKHIGFNRLL